jgi:hypothetical protein
VGLPDAVRQVEGVHQRLGNRHRPVKPPAPFLEALKYVLADIVSKSIIFWEFLAIYILTAVQDSNDHDPILIDTKINTALTIGKGPKARTDPITRGTRETELGDFIHLPYQILDKALGNYGIVLSDIGIDMDQVRLCRV